jgi:hypothetical protein
MLVIDIKILPFTSKVKKRWLKAFKTGKTRERRV